MTNFAKCVDDNFPLKGERFDKYGYKHGVQGFVPNRTMEVTRDGCVAICGNGIDWYSWEEISGTLTTWILPIIGILLQAPFVSNHFWQTVFSLARWVGSPMASLSYTLWNIKASGRCSMIVDMSIPYASRIPPRQSDFGSIRDSFYLLCTMNQYTRRRVVRQKKEAEGLLRITLFSKDIRLLKQVTDASGNVLNIPPYLQGAQPSGLHQNSVNLRSISASPITTSDLEPEGTLNELRQSLADYVRACRRRGVVPVYISTAWFLFAMALSIQTAFGILGKNATAHELALGCLLAWLPVLILCSIVDRNPVAAEEIQAKLNALVDRVRVSLMDNVVRDMYIHTIVDPDYQNKMRDWVDQISAECSTFDDFFVDFAGQGRVRWHYGCSHPIIKDLEKAYLAAKGRDWLRDEEEARTRLVLGRVGKGLNWWDHREKWQILGATIIVGGTVFGAFVISYFTPKMGLGCRSGGYLIYGIVSTVLLMSEMIAWWITDGPKPQYGFSYSVYNRLLALTKSVLRPMTSFTSASCHLVSSCIHSTVFRFFSRPRQDRISAALPKWKDLDALGKLDLTFFKPLEAINSVWLAYIVMAQTFGLYNTCECITSSWGGKNYVDFTQYNETNSSLTIIIWTTGTAVSVSIMCAALGYIVAEWCLQSHLSTSDETKAARGLHRTRRFRRLINPFVKLIRGTTNLGLILLQKMWALLNGTNTQTSIQRQATTLIWTDTTLRSDFNHGRTGNVQQSRVDTGIPMAEVAAREASNARLLAPEASSLRVSASSSSSQPPSGESSSVSPREHPLNHHQSSSGHERTASQE